MNQLLDKISESVKGFEEPIARYKSSETLLNLEEAQRFLEVRYKNNRQLRLSGV